MRFKDFIKEGQVRKATKDKNLAKSLLFSAEKDLRFLQTLKIDENSSRKIMTSYYDTLRSILEAVAAIDGYKIYSHEAFTYFLKEKSQELLSIKFDRFRKIRNRINYYGQNISIEEVKENIFEIKRMINFLIHKYLDEVKKRSS